MKINGQLWLTPNWDKSHRCPVWSGPKFAGPYAADGCPGGGTVRIDGNIEVYPHDRPWRAGTCMGCGCRVFPLALNWLHPGYLAYFGRRRIRDWWDDLAYRLRRAGLRIEDRYYDWRYGPIEDAGESVRQEASS